MQFDPYTTVLVAVMNNPKDWARVCDQHWYRIPVARAPRRGLNAPIVAFYQTKAFGRQGQAINYYAPVKAWESATRLELLPDEPDHPRVRELYYRLRLGSLTPLQRPIASAKWHRISFIVTHWARLESAGDVRDLLSGSIWEEHLWKSLRKLGRLAEEDNPDDW